MVVRSCSHFIRINFISNYLYTFHILPMSFRFLWPFISYRSVFLFKKFVFSILHKRNVAQFEFVLFECAFCAAHILYQESSLSSYIIVVNVDGRKKRWILNRWKFGAVESSDFLLQTVPKCVEKKRPHFK